MSTDLARTIGFLLAGGQGTRLHDLTLTDCKPALSFAGQFRIVDFSLANAVRSGVSHLIVASQYRPDSLHRHLARHWQPAFAEGGLLVREGPRVTGTPEGYRGTAGAVAANIGLIDAAGAHEVMVLAGDHVYEMDYAAMVAAHRATGAAVTVATHRVSLASAQAFGVIATDGHQRITGFAEKPRHPVPIPGLPSRVLVSLGVYVFNWPWLRAALLADAADPGSAHDFGHDILPAAVAAGVAGTYALEAAQTLTAPHAAPQLRNAPEAYWRDVGTLDAYRLAHLDFAATPPPCALPDLPGGARRGMTTALERISSEHEIVFGGLLAPTPGVAGAGRRGTLLDRSVVLPGACVLTGARLTRTIVAPRTVVPAGLVVGEDADEDARWFRRTPGGTTLVTAAMLQRRAAAQTRQIAGPGLLSAHLTSRTA